MLLGGVLAAFGGITVDDFEAQSDTFLRTAHHPTLGRSYLSCAYGPMLELLAYLASNGFSNYIASGGGRDFMRPISTSPVSRTSRSSLCCYVTTTPTASSRTRLALSRRGSARTRTPGR